MFPNPEYYKSPDKDLRIKYDLLIDQVIEDYDKGDAAGRKDTYNNALKQYRGILTEKTRPWKNCSNMNVPVTEIVVDTYHANLMDSFFGGSDIVDIKPISVNDVKTAEKRKQFLNWQLINEIELQEHADRLFEIALIYGDAYAKLRYERRVNVRTVKEKQTVINESGEPEEMEVDQQVEEVTYDAPIIETPLPDEIFLSQDATGIQKYECQYVIHRVDITKSEYLDRVKNQGYQDIDFKNAREQDIKQLYGSLKNTLKDYANTLYVLSDDEQRVTLLEWHGTFYNEDGDDYQEIVAVIHPGSRTICKARLNTLGFRPFVRFTPFPVAGLAYGRGVPEKVKTLQAQMNTIYNQRNDAAAIRIASPFFYTAGSSFDPTKYQVEPSGGYPVDNVADIRWYDGPDAPMSSYQEEQALWNYIDQLMATSETMKAILSRQDTTATEVAAATARGAIRFGLVFRRFERAMTSLIWMIARFDQEYMPAEKEYRVVGLDGKPLWDSIKSQEMAGKLDLAIRSANVLNDQAKITKATMIYDRLRTDPMVLSDIRSMYENTRYFIETVGGKDVNIDKQLSRPPQLMGRTTAEEHDLLNQGRFIVPFMTDDHQRHVLEHTGFMNQPDFQEINPSIQKMYQMHVQHHHSMDTAIRIMQSGGAYQQAGTPAVQPGASTPAPSPGQGYVGGPNGGGKGKNERRNK